MYKFISPLLFIFSISMNNATHIEKNMESPYHHQDSYEPKAGIQDLSNELILKIQDQMPVQTIINFSMTNKRYYATVNKTIESFLQKLTHFINSLSKELIEYLEHYILGVKLPRILYLDDTLDVLSYLNPQKEIRLNPSDSFESLRVRFEEKILCIPLLKDLLTYATHLRQRIHMIDVLSRCKPERYQISFKNQLLRLTNRQHMDGNECLRIMGELSKIQHSDVIACVDQTLRFSTANMDGYALANIINALSTMDSCQWIWFENDIIGFIPDHMNGYNRAQIIKELSQIDHNDLEHFITEALRFIRSDMGAYDYIHLIEILKEIDRSHLHDLIEHSLRLVNFAVDGGDRIRIIEFLSKVNPCDLPDVIDQVFPLFSRSMTLDQCLSIIKYLLRIVDPTQRKNILKQANLLMDNHMNNDERVNMIAILSEFHHDQLWAILLEALSFDLFSERFSFLKASSILNAEYDFTKIDVKNIVNQTLCLMTNSMNWEDFTDIMRILLNFNTLQRKELIHYVLSLTFDTMNNQDCIEIIKRSARQYKHALHRTIR